MIDSNAAKKKLDKGVELVGGGFVINGAYPVYFGSGTSRLWIMGESAAEGLWLLALVTGGR